MSAQHTVIAIKRALWRILEIGCAGLLMSLSPQVHAAFVINGNMADQTTFLNLINADSQGGGWSLNMMNQLVFTANANPQNVYANQLNALNNVNNVRTVNVMQNAPGVLGGAFGPLLMPALMAGTQVIDLGDIQAFTANGAAQIQPLLFTRGSVLLHELAELNMDGGAAAFPNAHNTGIMVQNAILVAQGVLGMRLAGNDLFVIAPAAPGAAFTTYEATTGFQTTAAVPAAGGQQALAIGARYNQIIRGRITGVNAPFNFDITNVARGILDSGFTYDGTGYDISIESVTVQVVPEPSLPALLCIGIAILVLQRRNNAVSSAIESARRSFYVVVARAT